MECTWRTTCHAHLMMISVPEHHPRVGYQDEKRSASDEERADGDVVHAYGHQAVHQFHVLGEAVQDPSQVGEAGATMSVVKDAAIPPHTKQQAHQTHYVPR